MNSKAAEKYKKGEALGKPKTDTFLLCYQRILDAAVRHDEIAVVRGLDSLEEALNFKPHPELAFRLLKLYRYCRKCVEKEQFDEVCRIIHTLKLTWERAIELDGLNANNPLPKTDKE